MLWEYPLISEIVNGKERCSTFKPGVFSVHCGEICHYKSCLPVMGMDHIRLYSQGFYSFYHPAGLKHKTGTVILIVSFLIAIKAFTVEVFLVLKQIYGDSIAVS